MGALAYLTRPRINSCIGVVVDDEAQTLLGQGNEIKNMKPRKEDIIQE